MRRTQTLFPLLLGVVVLVPCAAAAAAPSVSVSPTTVQRGGVLAVTGRGWPHGVRVELLVGPPRSEASHVAWVTTTGAGTLRGAITIAARASTGPFVLLACRNSCRIKTQASFRIVAADTPTRSCGHVDVPGGRAWKIRATNTTCDVGRPAAKTCLRGRRPAGWSVRYSASDDRVILRSGRRRVSFQLVGAGGCIPE